MLVRKFPFPLTLMVLEWIDGWIPVNFVEDENRYRGRVGIPSIFG